MGHCLDSWLVYILLRSFLCEKPTSLELLHSALKKKKIEDDYESK